MGEPTVREVRRFLLTHQILQRPASAEVFRGTPLEDRMPARKPPPFVHHDGRWYVNPIWERKPSAAALRRALEEILARHSPASLLLLRPLTKPEVRLLERYRCDSDAEMLARLLAPDEVHREAGIGRRGARRS